MNIFRCELRKETEIKIVMKQNDIRLDRHTVRAVNT